MSQANDKTSIWHDTAIKLIQFAKKFKNSNNEFERQVGFLLLDVGVETLFRSYLTMPDTKSKLSFTRREEAAKGTVEKKDIIGEKFTLAGFDELSFHKLVEAVGKVADPSIDESILKEVEHYHNIRNKIYHLGEGIVPAKEKFEGYLKLTDKLLESLIKRKSKSHEYQKGDENEVVEVLERELGFAVRESWFLEFKVNISLAAEAVNPKYTTRNIEAGLKELPTDIDLDITLDDIEEKYYERKNKIEEFQKLTGIISDNVTFIDNVIDDITYLYLFVLLESKKIEGDDINKYLEYRSLIEKINGDPDLATTEDKEKLRRIHEWAHTLTSKLWPLHNEQKSNTKE